MDVGHQKVLGFAITSAHDGRRAPALVVGRGQVCVCYVLVDERFSLVDGGRGCGGGAQSCEVVRCVQPGRKEGWADGIGRRCQAKALVADWEPTLCDGGACERGQGWEEDV